jgi:hypothetical protein
MGMMSGCRCAVCEFGVTDEPIRSKGIRTFEANGTPTSAESMQRASALRLAALLGEGIGVRQHMLNIGCELRGGALPAGWAEQGQAEHGHLVQGLGHRSRVGALAQVVDAEGQAITGRQIRLGHGSSPYLWPVICTN